MGFRKEAGRNVIDRQTNNSYDFARMAAIHVSVPEADISELALNSHAYYAGI